MPNEREKMLASLEALYGHPIKEGGQIRYSKLGNKEIAQELGSDDGQFSKILNPPVGKERSDEAHRRINTRLNLIRLNRKNEKQIKSLKFICKVLGFVLAAVIILALSLYIKTPLPNPEKAETNLVLTMEEQRAMFDLYGGYIQNRLTLEALAFNHSLKQGIYKDDIAHQINELGERCQTGIEDARRMMKRIQLRNHNGILLSDLYAAYSKNNRVEGNLKELVPILLNQEASSSEIILAVKSKIKQAQVRNEREFERAPTTLPKTGKEKKEEEVLPVSIPVSGKKSL